MVRTAQDEARPLFGDVTLLTSDDLLIGCIEQNFDLGINQSVCKTADNIRAEPFSDSQVQYRLRRLERRCTKLKRKLQDKEATILALQEQQHSCLPLLMHETMRSLRSLESDQLNDSTDGLPISQSVICSMAHEPSEVDARIHEYERQIAELYEENQQERLKNEMLNECLRELKQAKTKLMKACKQAKQELQALKDTGLSQMLMDIEVRCDSLEKEKAQVMDELLAERSVRMERELSLKATTEQLKKLMLDSTKWEGIVARIRQKLLHSRDQICEQQMTIENLNADLKQFERRTSHSSDFCQDDKQEEIEQLGSISSVLRAKVREVEEELRHVQTENHILRDQLTIRNGEQLLESGEFPWKTRDTNGKLLIQIRNISKRLRALKEMVQVYKETNTIDINLLGEREFSCKIKSKDDSFASKVDVAQLSCSVLEAARCVNELQLTVEDACARLMGSTCAMQ